MYLEIFTASWGENERLADIMDVIRSNKAFSETLSALKFRKANGDLNNNSIIRMVEGYFTELTFIITRKNTPPSLGGEMNCAKLS